MTYYQIPVGLVPNAISFYNLQVSKLNNSISNLKEPNSKPTKPTYKLIYAHFLARQGHIAKLTMLLSRLTKHIIQTP